jgi:hypothetical protein
VSEEVNSKVVKGDQDIGKKDQRVKAADEIKKFKVQSKKYELE